MMTKNHEITKVCIVTHVFATGPAQELNEYLRNKVKKMMFIGHPFVYARDIRSFYTITIDGKKVIEKRAKTWKLPEYFLYIKDAIYTILWVLQSKTVYDVYVGADPLNAFVGIFLKRIKRVKKVIFYTIDYVPKRFNNSILNFFYHQIDSYCVRHCDKVWNLSQRMIEERQKKGVCTKNQIVVPIGVQFNRIHRLPLDRVNRKTLIYMGHLRKRQGVELIIDAMPEIIGKIPDIRLMIIGGGELEEYIREKINQFHMETNVKLLGFIEDHQKLEEIMTTCAIGLAIYEPDPESYTYYADPSKPKQYMACGLPIIITNVPWISQDVMKKRLGYVINYDKHELINSIIDLSCRDPDYIEYRENAIKYASQLEWENIFSSAIEQID